MPKLRVGHAANSKLNGEWAGHVRRWMKKVTAGKRRSQDKIVIRRELSDLRLSS